MAIESATGKLAVTPLSGTKIATGYTLPTVTAILDYTWSHRYTFAVAKTAFENATPATAFAALVTAIETQIDTAIAFFDATDTVTVYAKFVDYTINQSATDPDVSMSTTAESYSCVVDVFIKSV
jgi:hypothetical protein